MRKARQMKAAVLLFSTLVAFPATATAQTPAAASPAACYRVTLRLKEVFWSARFSFDTSKAAPNVEIPVLAKDTNGYYDNGSWERVTGDSLRIILGFVDSGFDIRLAPLKGDSIRGVAKEWGMGAPGVWSALATKTSDCPGPDSSLWPSLLPPMRVRPPA